MYTHEDEDTYLTEKSEFGNTPRPVVPRSEDSFASMFNMVRGGKVISKPEMKTGTFKDMQKFRPQRDHKGPAF